MKSEMSTHGARGAIANHTPRRPYESPLRAEQREQTRLRIFEAVVEELTDQDLQDLSVPAIAARARVALRTVYRYFPTKDALLDAFCEWWISQRLQTVQYEGASPQDLPRIIREHYAALDREPEVIRAMMVSRAGQQVRDRRRPRQLRSFAQALENLTARMDPSDARGALAAIHTLDTAPTWQHLREHWGLSTEEAARAAAWAASVLIRELEDNPDSLKETHTC